MDELTSKIKARIDSLPVVDIHAHHDGGHPDARDARQILFFHQIVTELVSAGMPREIFSSQISVEEAVKRSLPYFRRIRNTTTHWCLMQMLTGLYGFEADGIYETNWRDILEVIQAKTERKDWYREILGQRTHIEKTFLNWNYDRDVPQHDQAFFVGVLRIDRLVDSPERQAIEDLGNSVKTSVVSPEDVKHALDLLIEKFVGAGCVAVGASFQPGYQYRKSDESLGRSAVRNLISKDSVKPSDKAYTGSFVLDHILALCQEHRVPFQALIGAKRQVPGTSPPDYGIAAFEQDMISSLCPMFHRFGEVAFDILLSNRIQSHELAVIAREYPNVHASGYWWYTFYPTVMKEFLRERLQMMPGNKTNAFFSDAVVTQWSYAKLALVRSGLAAVLSEMVREGYFSQGLAEEVAADVLCGNARELYTTR